MPVYIVICDCHGTIGTYTNESDAKDARDKHRETDDCDCPIRIVISG